jgi:arylsulfatase A-like enzyme
MKLKIFLPIGIILLPSLWYLLAPLSSDHFKKFTDVALLKSKQAFLLEANIVADSIQKPNVIWIVVDDLGYYDTDLYGENGSVEAPHIKSLAEEGVLFTQGFTTSPVCSPSRAAILTGRYNQRFGFEHQLHDRYLSNQIEYYGFKYFINDPVWKPIARDSVPNQAFVDQIGLPLSEISIAELLKKQGYRTGLMGKWHVSKQKEQSPSAFGFDEFYGFYSSHSLYSPEGSEGIVDMKNPADWTDDYIWSGQREGRHAIQRNDEVIQEDRYLTTAIADESIAFMENNGSKPFFLMASFNAPHTPFQVPQAYYDQYADVEDPVKRTYYGMIKCLDDEIGRLLDYLEESGLAENTAIFFISDNGGAAYTLATNNAPLKGGKITNFDGGVKVPFILKTADMKEAQIYDKPVSSTDLFVTTAALAGQALPDRTYDGVNLLDHIQDNSVAHEYLFYRKGFNQMIRTPEYKLIWNTELDIDTLLFRIDEDPGEKNNLFYSERALADSLFMVFDQWEKGLRSPAWPSVVYFNFEDENGDVFVYEN